MPSLVPWRVNYEQPGYEYEQPGYMPNTKGVHVQIPKLDIQIFL